MAHVENRDLLSVPAGVMCQQVNCQGKMGKGLALAVRGKFPAAYDAYMRKYNGEGWKVGDAQFVPVGPRLFIANLAGQDTYGNTGLHTDYAGLEVALAQAQAFAWTNSVPLYLPYGLGSGLAGGDWGKVSGIIRRAAPEAIICKIGS